MTAQVLRTVHLVKTTIAHHATRAYIREMPIALLSVYDKTGIVELAAGLHAAGWRLVSSGGTAKAIAEAGIAVTDLADLTGLPAILDHRVVTLHPKVHGGLLADPTNPQHQADMAAHGIEAIDLVVVNLYPFASNPSIELIDIGGPAMVRAAAKNHAHVGVVVNPVDYQSVLGEITAEGHLSAATRRRLARDAFATIAAYDAAIANWFDAPSPDSTDALPVGLHLSLERAQTLRYGENPHQQGARYRLAGGTSWWDTAVQHQGKELSYLNLYDTEAAWKLVQRFGRPACVIVKHANPCGVAVADTIEQAYAQANACDPVSAFGGIVALNRPVTRAVAEALGAGVHRGRGRPVVRRRRAGGVRREGQPASAQRRARRTASSLDMRSIDGGLLVQHADTVSPDRSAWQVVTDRAAHARAVGRPRVRMAGVRRRQQQRDRVREGRSRLRHRRRPAEPARQRPHRRRPVSRPRRRWGVRQRCVLPVPRRPRRHRRCRHQGRHPARRQHARRRK